MPVGRPKTGGITTLNEREAARALGISPTTLGRERAAGRAPHVRVRGRVLYRPCDLELFLTVHERVRGELAEAG